MQSNNISRSPRNATNNKVLGFQILSYRFIKWNDVIFSKEQNINSQRLSEKPVSDVILFTDI